MPELPASLNEIRELFEHLPGPEFGVAFEFESAAPEFWPVDFPPADWNVVPSET